MDDVVIVDGRDRAALEARGERRGRADRTRRDADDGLSRPTALSSSTDGDRRRDMTNDVTT